MGQKVNPHGARVGVIFDWSTRWYSDKKLFASQIKEDYELRNELKAKFYDETMAEYLRWLWNSPNKGQNPYVMFGGIMRPAGRDANGDIFYVWNGEAVAARKAEG